MHHVPFFWLHIKKSAGSSIRKLLQPYYKEVDRDKKPPNFIQSHPAEYNDILNNYRVVLGEYQFRRCLFAKNYLYKDEWNDIFSFAFSRNPTDRCLSMFYYLYLNDAGFIRNLMRSLKGSVNTRKLHFSTAFAFDAFLENVQKARVSDSIYRPFGSHFTTHTAPVWEDITDLDGNILLKTVFRLENLVEGINRAFEESGIDDRLNTNETRLNRNKGRRSYTPTKGQLRKIENIYLHDFELYENAGN